MSTELREVASGLQFPEGPVALPDGSVLVVEIQRGTLSRVTDDGRVQVVARLGGGPNGAALGPDGAVYVTNNGGSLRWVRYDGLTVPGAPCPPTWSGGRVQRVDLESGAVEDLYTSCDDRPLCAPNDLVFDRHGGFWFTDRGRTREREIDRTGVFYARADGSAIHEAVFPVDGPNGVGLSPDHRRLYVAETPTGRVMWWDVGAPGEVVPVPGIRPGGASLLAGLPGWQLLDSMAVEDGGNVCVATLLNGGITVIGPDGTVLDHVPTGDPMTTNLCFGGDDLRTAFITLSGTGRLVAARWPRPGLRLEHSLV